MYQFQTFLSYYLRFSSTNINNREGFSHRSVLEIDYTIRLSCKNYHWHSCNISGNFHFNSEQY